MSEYPLKAKREQSEWDMACVRERTQFVSVATRQESRLAPPN